MMGRIVDERRSPNSRVAYALGSKDLPKPVTVPQWQLDSKFNVAEELLEDSSLRDVIKGAKGLR